MKVFLHNIFKYSWFLLGFILFMIFISLITTYSSLPISVNNIIIFIYSIINMFLIGFLRGKKCDKQGFLNGFLIGLLVVFILYLLGGIFFCFKIYLYKIIYYLVLILCSTMGAMVGINTKK